MIDSAQVLQSGQMSKDTPALTSNSLEELKSRLLPLCEAKQLLILFNKSDLLTAAQRSSLSALFTEVNAPQLFISAKQKEELETLKAELLKAAALPEVSAGDVIVTNVRHYEALTRALDAIHRVEQGLQMQLSGDFIAQDIRECIFHLSDIAGQVTTDDVLQNIFSHFCIGK